MPIEQITIESAIKYVDAQISGFDKLAFVINAFDSLTDEGAVDVVFQHANRIELYTVWRLDGRIYGEW
jgi:hypothetical protein